MCIYFTVLISHTCFVHPVGDTLRSYPSGAFSVSQDQRAILVFPLKMKCGGKSCPAAFPPAIRVIVSLVPVLECIDLEPFLYIYKVVVSSIFNALYKDHKITQYITQTKFKIKFTSYVNVMLDRCIYLNFKFVFKMITNISEISKTIRGLQIHRAPNSNKLT